MTMKAFTFHLEVGIPDVAERVVIEAADYDTARAKLLADRPGAVVIDQPLDEYLTGMKG
jgi:hypothetical protein